MMDVNSLYKRFNTLKEEVTYIQRKRAEEAAKAAAALAQITDKDVELLKEHLPVVEEIRQYTAEQLLANENGELEKVRRFYNSLASLVEQWLKHYEDALC